MKRLLLLLFLTSGSFGTWAQSVFDKTLDGTEQGKNLPTVLQEIERTQPVKFYFLPQWIDQMYFGKPHVGLTLREAIDDLIFGTDLNYIVFQDYAFVFVKDPTQELQRKRIINKAARERKAIQRIQIGTPEQGRLTKKVTLRGKVIDTKSKDPLGGTQVIVSDLQIAAMTDAAGRFELSFPPGEHVINFRLGSYDELIYDLGIYTNAELPPIKLEETPIMLDEVEVLGTNKEITTSRIGQSHIVMRELKRQPALLGEVDIIKQIQKMPGVTTAGEAASGFNVRGGGVDQNLVLYDGIPVFNSSHVFGFFSTFNAEAIRDVTFYKGGIPAEYGGRVSSVLDVASREGDMQKWNGSGGIGIISSNLMINGPLVKDKTSIAGSMRYAYPDLLVNSIRTNYADLKNSRVKFYDGTFKVTHRFSGNSKLVGSFYRSSDQFLLKGDTSYQWASTLGSLRFDHSFSSRLQSSFILGMGSYGYSVIDKQPQTGFNLGYKITYPSFKADFQWQAGAHNFSFGLQSIYYKFDPGTLKPSSESNAKYIKIQQQLSLESAVYLGDAYTINEQNAVEGGVRVSLFNSIGPATVNTYTPGTPIETFNQTGTVNYKSGQVFKTYHGIEPRFTFRHNLNETSSIKFGYNRIYQYMNLVTNTVAVTPVDIWQPSNQYFKPQVADQGSIGYFRNFKNRAYEASVETYYKKIQNVLDFKDGAQLILNDHLETDLIQGKGRAYGIEFSVAKNVGRLTGSLNYTYSRSLRTIKGSTPEESINKGKEYPSNYDQPNIINLSWRYEITKRIFSTGVFTYHTGRPISAPLASYEVENIPIVNFSERNQYRIRDYHRLDIGFVIEGNYKRNKPWSGSWTLSFYNAYGRKNPYTVFFKDNGQGVFNAYQLSIIGTVLPSLTYNFKF